ncbi:MAG: methylmalonyl-CoA mutase [Rhizobiales bacterium]|nr:methylmalonyl-CoA mutase [Hyphomicrobiales bacterium]
MADKLDIFPNVTEADWRALVAKTVKEGAESLAARSDDGIAIAPLHPQTAPGAVLHAAARWKVIQRIDLADPAAAKRQLSEDLAEGADGVEIVGASAATARGAGIGPAHLESVARAGALADTHLRIDAGPASPALALAFAKGSGVASLTAAFDPCASPVPGNDMADAVALARALDHHDIAGSALIADGRPWNDRGAGDVEELAAILAGFVAHLRALDAAGYAADSAAARVGVALAADTDQFLTIAKLRAARLLVARILEASNLAPRTVPIHAETAWRVMTALDPHTNMLRATIAAFGAAVGGADSIAVLPFDAVPGPASAHARRLARNSQLLLLDEAHLARVGDPAAGSGAIEALTEALAASAWSLFQSVEAAGGLAHAGGRQGLADQVAGTAASRAARIEGREELIVGSSIYPLAGEAAPPSGPDLGIHRLAEFFEKARREQAPPA